MRYLFFAAAAVVILLSVSTLASGQEINLVANGSFESPVISGVGGGGLPLVYEYQPQSSDWYYNVGGGISNNGGNGRYPGFDTMGPIPNGNQYCFIQGSGDYVSEPVNLPLSGTYELDYYAGGRSNYGGGYSLSVYVGNTTYDVTLGSTVSATGTTTTNSAMTQQGPIYFSTSAGTQTLEIQVTTGGTALFDAVSITPVSTPEPSTLALLGAGAVGLVGYAWRWRRKQRRSSSTHPNRPSNPVVPVATGSSRRSAASGLTAGRTQQPIDPVRHQIWYTNRRSQRTSARVAVRRLRGSSSRHRYPS